MGRAGLPPLGELRRSDLPRFFRAADLDPAFPADRLVASFAETLDGLGIDLRGQANVHLDAEPRRTKSPRAFCSTPRVPDEVYLVIAPTGGRDDYGALFHEGGHAEHYANTDPGLAFEFRHLGDNSVTESFAFLIEHLIEDRDWLRRQARGGGPRAGGRSRPRRQAGDAAPLRGQARLRARAARALRRRFRRCPAATRSCSTEAIRVPWPRASWLADVDGGFYAACYLRAWALETHWRAALEERFGSRWFASPEAGEWLRSLWRQGQRLDAAELLAETLGGELDLAVLAAELTAGRPRLRYLSRRSISVSTPLRALPRFSRVAQLAQLGRAQVAEP